VGLSDVLEAVSQWPDHGVDIDLVEKRCWDGNSGRDVNLGGLMQLALVAGVDKPSDVLLEQGPPEAI
jgi:hypothetical protein